MQLTEYWQVFLVALAGGIIAEALHWWTLYRNEPAAFPRYRTSVGYWITAAIVCLGAALVALLQLGTPANGMAAACPLAALGVGLYHR
jgi:hypothetical protein